MAGLLYANSIKINDKISIVIPKLGDVIDSEDNYFEMVSSVMAMPSDMMVQLDDIGIDYTKISHYELFILMFKRLQMLDTHMLFGDLDLSKFQTAINEQNNELVLRDDENSVVIDRAVHQSIFKAVCKMMFVEKKEKMPAGEETRKYLIERARKKLLRQMREQKDNSSLENLIVGLVNTEQFSYTYQTIRELTLYQFYASLNQVSHKISYDNTMHGYFAGTVKFEDIAKENRTWIKM